ncbi:MAG: CHAT domain-containing protein [Oscillatoriaceae cyanobacterium]
MGEEKKRCHWWGGAAIGKVLSLAVVGYAWGMLSLSGVLAAEMSEEATSAALQAVAAGVQLYRQGTGAALREAIVQWEEAVKLYEDMGDRANAAAILTNIGKVKADLGEYQAALKFYKRALPEIKAVGDQHTEAATLNAIASVLVILGEYQPAFDAYNQALSLWEEVGYLTGKAETINNIGLLYAQLGEYHQALSYYQKALEIVQTVENIQGIANTYNNMGSAYSELFAEKPQWSEAALESYSSALTLAEKIGDRRLIAATLNNIGFMRAKMATERGQWEAALTTYEQALPAWRQLGDLRSEAATLNNIGFVYGQLGNESQALQYYNEALKLRRKVGDKGGSALTLYRIAETEKNRGQLTGAIKTIEEALAIIEDLRTNINSTDLRASFLASKQDYYELYINLLMQLHEAEPEAGYDARALGVSERARARSLLDILAEAKAEIRNGANPELLEQERQLQQQLAAAQKRLLDQFSSATADTRAALQSDVDELVVQYRVLQGQIRETSPRYAALKYPQTLSLKAIQEQVLDENTILLEYFLGAERSTVWVVSKTGLASYSLPSRAEIESAARDFRDILLQPLRRNSPKQVAARARLLSNLILAPFARELADGKRLLIVADGALQYVPFAALSAPLKEGEEYVPLVIEREIVSAASASTIAELRSATAGRPLAPKTLAVLADPVFDKEDDRLDQLQDRDIAAATNLELERALNVGFSLPRLPYTQQEAQQILNLVSDRDTQGVFGFRANLETATSKELGQYRIIHFATHGLLNAVNPELSGLIMSFWDETGKPIDGFLPMYEIFNLNLPAELVVLSACQTGLGKKVRGEGLVGLTRSFMYAGAARVMVSLWSVDDEGTAELMVNFYRGILTRGLSAPAALRAAQIQMWQQEQWRNPYYWAAFNLQGEWR